jgi:hypothetical protein
MKRVIIESPLSGEVEVNRQYARACLFDSLKRGEAPLASHLLYTQVLDDGIEEERRMGMEAGFAWNLKAEEVVVYTDRGISKGMKAGIKLAQENLIPIQYRTLGEGWAEITHKGLDKIPFVTTNEQLNKIPTMMVAMEDLGLSVDFIKNVAHLAHFDQGIFDLMSLLVDEEDIKERSSILTDLQDLMNDYMGMMRDEL